MEGGLLVQEAGLLGQEVDLAGPGGLTWMVWEVGPDGSGGATRMVQEVDLAGIGSLAWRSWLRAAAKFPQIDILFPEREFFFENPPVTTI
jgi:hypothetical protein